MTAIDDKYAALGGPGGWLGQPTINESIAPDGTGRYLNARSAGEMAERFTRALALAEPAV